GDDAGWREERAVAYALGALLTIDGPHDVVTAMGWFEAAKRLVATMGPLRTPFLRMVDPLYQMFAIFEKRQAPADGEFEMPVNDPDPWVSAVSLLMRAHMMLNLGRAHDRANEDFAASLALFRSIGERWGMSFALNSLAMLAGWRG